MDMDRREADMRHHVLGADGNQPNMREPAPTMCCCSWQMTEGKTRRLSSIILGIFGSCLDPFDSLTSRVDEAWRGVNVENAIVKPYLIFDLAGNPLDSYCHPAGRPR